MKKNSKIFAPGAVDNWTGARERPGQPPGFPARTGVHGGESGAGASHLRSRHRVSAASDVI